MRAKFRRLLAVTAIAAGTAVGAGGVQSASAIAPTWHYLYNNIDPAMAVKSPGASCTAAQYNQFSQTAWHTILWCGPLQTSPVTYHYTYLKLNQANGDVCSSDGYFRGVAPLPLPQSQQKRNVARCAGTLSFRVNATAVQSATLRRAAGTSFGG